MRSKRHIQPKSHSEEAETWVFEQDQDKEGTEVVDEEVEEGTVELESLDVFPMEGGRVEWS
jgi:hypothetical protein